MCLLNREIARTGVHIHPARRKHPSPLAVRAHRPPGLPPKSTQGRFVSFVFTPASRPPRQESGPTAIRRDPHTFSVSTAGPQARAASRPLRQSRVPSHGRRSAQPPLPAFCRGRGARQPPSRQLGASCQGGNPGVRGRCVPDGARKPTVRRLALRHCASPLPATARAETQPRPGARWRLPGGHPPCRPPLRDATLSSRAAGELRAQPLPPGAPGSRAGRPRRVRHRRCSRPSTWGRARAQRARGLLRAREPLWPPRRARCRSPSP